MATIVFKDFTMEVIETLDELKAVMRVWDYIEVNEFIHKELPTHKVLIKVNEIKLIRE
jgi:hypothetical protein